jgi:hypothetical protein
MVVLYIIWTYLGYWRHYHENILCLAQTLSVLTGIAALLYRKFWQKRLKAERYRTAVSEADVQDVTTQTDLVFRQVWNEDLKKWSRGRFYYGYTTCMNITRYLIWKPIVMLKVPHHNQKEALSELEAAHPLEQPDLWKRLQKK